MAVQFSRGNTINPDGSQTPTYSQPVQMLAQVQALTYADLRQIEGLNLQGTRRAIYFYGDVEGIVRPFFKGGDLITFPDGTVWLVAQQLETFGAYNSTDVWCKVVVTLQNQKAYPNPVP